MTLRSQLILSGCGIAVSIYAAICSWQIARADLLSRGGSLAKVDAAIRISPDNEEYQLRRAGLLEDAGEDPLPPLQRAAALNPYDAGALIRLGLQYDIAGKVNIAEHSLLEAARISRLYEPRWTLANFYFRRQKKPEFWHWAREALSVSYDPADALFALCLNLDSDPASVFTRVIPDRQLVVDQYLTYLTATGHVSDSLSVARRLLKYPRVNETRSLLPYVDALAQAGLIEPAIEVWNGLVGVGLAPQPTLDPKGGISLSNPEFLGKPLNHGLDWRVTTVDGIVTEHVPGRLQFSFSGREPESIEVLTHWLPLVEGYQYKLTYEYQTIDIPPVSGLTFHIAGKELNIESPQLSSEDWRSDYVLFRAASDCLCQLHLNYTRPLGHTRIEGTLRLRKVTLQRIP